MSQCLSSLVGTLLYFYIGITDTLLGFNFNELIGVLPTCTSESEPPKYEPLRIGDVSLLLLYYLSDIANDSQWNYIRLNQSHNKILKEREAAKTKAMVDEM